MLPQQAANMEEPPAKAANKRKSEDLLSHDVLHQAAKNKISQQETTINHGFPLLGTHRVILPLPSPQSEKKDDEGEGTDLITNLPNDILGKIISRLTTKEGAGTQLVAKRWRPLWRSSPLNLQVDKSLSTQVRKRISIVNKILSTHEGSGRRLCMQHIRLGKDGKLYSKFDSWLQSPALNNLEELEFSYCISSEPDETPLPPSALRFSLTLCVINLGNCHFPTDGTHELHFPELKQLSLHGVTISEDTLQGFLSACPALESLLILDCYGFDRVCIRSKCIRSIGVRSSYGCLPRDDIILQEVVIMEAPCLQRLLTFPPKGPTTIQVSGVVPKLEVLGYLSNEMAELQIGSMILKEMVAVGSTATISTVKVLVIMSASLDLGAVLRLLNCFPCLEKMYIVFSISRNDTGDVWQHYPLEPVQCLTHHLKKIVIRGYQGFGLDIYFAKFFVMNARVLQMMKIGVPKKYNDKWVANQRMKLQLENKVSKDAQFHFAYDYWLVERDCGRCTHDLSMSDPFDP